MKSSRGLSPEGNNMSTVYYRLVEFMKSTLPSVFRRRPTDSDCWVRWQRWAVWMRTDVI